MESHELSFGERLARSDDPWRFSPFQLRTIWKVGTRVNVDLFASLVRGYDVVETEWVLRGFREGFPIGIPEQGPFPPERIWADSSVPAESKVFIEDFSTLKGRQVGSTDPSRPHMANTGVVCVPIPCRLFRRAPTGGGLSVICHSVGHSFLQMALLAKSLYPNARTSVRLCMMSLDIMQEFLLATSTLLKVSEPKCTTAKELRCLIERKGVLEGFICFCSSKGLVSKTISGYMDGLKHLASDLEDVPCIPGAAVLARMLIGQDRAGEVGEAP